MISYLVIGICIFLLLAVIYIAAKPISMGIEARRNYSDNIEPSKTEDEIEDTSINELVDKNSISDEIIKLNQLKNDGVITEEEYLKAKEKLLS
tara:strand:- start:2747 stop:3025 length:279 start_codon:yes stop_codon:yes gene_type:complete